MSEHLGPSSLSMRQRVKACKAAMLDNLCQDVGQWDPDGILGREYGIDAFVKAQTEVGAELYRRAVRLTEG